MVTEVCMDSYMYGLISNSLLPGASSDSEKAQLLLNPSFRVSLSLVHTSVPVQSRTNQQAILETNSSLPQSHSKVTLAEGLSDTFYYIYWRNWAPDNN